MSKMFIETKLKIKGAEMKADYIECMAVSKFLEEVRELVDDDSYMILKGVLDRWEREAQEGLGEMEKER